MHIDNTQKSIRIAKILLYTAFVIVWLNVLASLCYAAFEQFTGMFPDSVWGRTCFVVSLVWLGSFYFNLRILRNSITAKWLEVLQAQINNMTYIIFISIHISIVMIISSKIF